jgi:hypothetical protein
VATGMTPAALLADPAGLEDVIALMEGRSRRAAAKAREAALLQTLIGKAG